MIQRYHQYFFLLNKELPHEEHLIGQVKTALQRKCFMNTAKMSIYWGKKRTLDEG